jgi:hypothetical protein
MQPDKPDDAKKSDTGHTLSTPYGPHPGHVDDASGGAESSPFETMSSDEREELRKAVRRSEGTGDDSDASRH